MAIPPHPTSARRIASGVSSLANCLTAGAVFTFPLWSPLFDRVFKLSTTQLNLLASAGILGEYVSAASFGQLADKRGPGAVSFAAAVLFGVGFGLLGWRYQVGVETRARGEKTWEHEWMVLAIFYSLTGCATAASYFSAMISCTKSAPARHSGLAIGVPCAVFGLSPLFLSFIASAFTTTSRTADTTGELDAGRYLFFLGAFLFVVNGVGAICIKELPWEDNLEKVIIDALEPPLDAGESGFSPSAVPSIDGQGSTERTSLLPPRRPPSPASPNAEQTLRELLSTASFWLLGAVVFFSTGPAEMVMASIGTILESLVSPGHTPAFPSSSTSPSQALTLRRRHVSALSLANTVSRLVVGATSDWLATGPTRRPDETRGDAAVPARKAVWRKSIRLWFVGAACLLLAVAYGWGGTGLSTPAGLWVVTLVTGTSYGTVFTLTPALVRTRWGMGSFGRNWGLLTWFSAAGALLFTPLFGLLRDLATPSSPEGTCLGPKCYRPIFALSAASALIATGVVVMLGKRWARRI
ncbi:hypothetical protein JCM11251_004648 [Rhodosporidiobolus azoricus]